MKASGLVHGRPWLMAWGFRRLSWPWSWGISESWGKCRDRVLECLALRGHESGSAEDRSTCGTDHYRNNRPNPSPIRHFSPRPQGRGSIPRRFSPSRRESRPAQSTSRGGRPRRRTVADGWPEATVRRFSLENKASNALSDGSAGRYFPNPSASIFFFAPVRGGPHLCTSELRVRVKKNFSPTPGKDRPNRPNRPKSAQVLKQ